jgi:hypothetical protein
MTFLNHRENAVMSIGGGALVSACRHGAGVVINARAKACAEVQLAVGKLGVDGFQGPSFIRE